MEVTDKVNINNTPMTNNGMAQRQPTPIEYNQEYLDYTTSNNLFDDPIIIEIMAIQLDNDNHIVH